jgi:hypothetical protein
LARRGCRRASGPPPGHAPACALRTRSRARVNRLRGHGQGSCHRPGGPHAGARGVARAGAGGGRSAGGTAAAAAEFDALMLTRLAWSSSREFPVAATRDVPRIRRGRVLPAAALVMAPVRLLPHRGLTAEVACHCCIVSGRRVSASRAVLCAGLLYRSQELLLPVPVPCWQVSVPGPPFSVSFPGPPRSTSLPSPPYSLSLPRKPATESSPLRP